jgi:integrase
VVKQGKTPVWSREDTKKLLESIPRNDLAGPRDRALICGMLFSIVGISAVLSLERKDFYYQGSRRWLRFHENGGKEHGMPDHPEIERALDEYLSRVIIADNQPYSERLLRVFQIPLAAYPGSRGFDGPPLLKPRQINSLVSDGRPTLRTYLV